MDRARPVVGLRAGVRSCGRPALVIACVWATDLVASVLKAAVDRARPFERIPEADPLIHGIIGKSFPSGHAATSAAGAFVLAARRAARRAVLRAPGGRDRLLARVRRRRTTRSTCTAGAMVGFAVAGVVLAAVRLLRPIQEARDDQPTADTRLIQMPTLRPSSTKSSGIEIRRMRTKTSSRSSRAR